MSVLRMPVCGSFLAQYWMLHRAALDFQHGLNGKPYLASPQESLDGLHFNLSHTQGAVAVAIARQPVGVDIEIQRDMPDLLEIAETVFADETIAAIANAARGPTAPFSFLSPLGTRRSTD